MDMHLFAILLSIDICLYKTFHLSFHHAYITPEEMTDVSNFFLARLTCVKHNLQALQSNYNTQKLD